MNCLAIVEEQQDSQTENRSHQSFLASKKHNVVRMPENAACLASSAWSSAASVCAAVPSLSSDSTGSALTRRRFLRVWETCSLTWYVQLKRAPSLDRVNSPGRSSLVKRAASVTLLPTTCRAPVVDLKVLGANRRLPHSSWTHALGGHYSLKPFGTTLPSTATEQEMPD